MVEKLDKNWLKQEQDSRRVFIDTLCELAGKDKTVGLVICDVGFNYTEGFEQKFPERYWNLGTTEFSSMAEVAGMALEGMKIYIYSMINFMLLRPAEPLRNCIIKHKADVKIIGVKGSEKFKFLGFSHNLDYENQDVDICKILGLDYRIPQSNEEVKKVILEMYNSKEPVYCRL